jgi:hypothetical protein
MKVVVLDYGPFHRFLIFDLLAELLPMEKSKNISGYFLLFFAFIPPDYLAGSKLTMLSKGRLFS